MLDDRLWQAVLILPKLWPVSPVSYDNKPCKSVNPYCATKPLRIATAIYSGTGIECNITIRYRSASRPDRVKIKHVAVQQM